MIISIPSVLPFRASLLMYRRVIWRLYNATNNFCGARSHDASHALPVACTESTPGLERISLTPYEPLFHSCGRRAKHWRINSSVPARRCLAGPSLLPTYGRDPLTPGRAGESVLPMYSVTGLTDDISGVHPPLRQWYYDSQNDGG